MYVEEVSESAKKKKFDFKLQWQCLMKTRKIILEQ
jgi:hypothetical protein